MGEHMEQKQTPVVPPSVPTTDEEDYTDFIEWTPDEEAEFMRIVEENTQKDL